MYHCKKNCTNADSLIIHSFNKIFVSVRDIIINWNFTPFLFIWFAHLATSYHWIRTNNIDSHIPNACTAKTNIFHFTHFVIQPRLNIGFTLSTILNTCHCRIFDKVIIVTMNKMVRCNVGSYYCSYNQLWSSCLFSRDRTINNIEFAFVDLIGLSSDLKP